MAAETIGNALYWTISLVIVSYGIRFIAMHTAEIKRCFKRKA